MLIPMRCGQHSLDGDKCRDIVIHMRYVALLRGINVGGNNKIKMADLKAAVEKAGYTNVVTLIQSGNVIFDSSIKDQEKIAKQLEQVILKTFKVTSRVVIRSLSQMKKVLAEVPKSWARSDIRKYVAFIKEPVTAVAVAHGIPAREGVDILDVGDGVLYMATEMSGLTRSAYNKIVGTKIYQDMTLRNFNTTQKILAIMENK